MEWTRVGDRKVYDVSASKDALWIIDSPSDTPYIYDEVLGRFIQRGNREAGRISTGVDGHAVIRA